jgi:hypothetical protein
MYPIPYGQTAEVLVRFGYAQKVTNLSDGWKYTFSGWAETVCIHLICMDGKILTIEPKAIYFQLF